MFHLKCVYTVQIWVLFMQCIFRGIREPNVGAKQLHQVMSLSWFHHFRIRKNRWALHLFLLHLKEWKHSFKIWNWNTVGMYKSTNLVKCYIQMNSPAVSRRSTQTFKSADWLSLTALSHSIFDSKKSMILIANGFASSRLISLASCPSNLIKNVTAWLTCLAPAKEKK